MDDLSLIALNTHGSLLYRLRDGFSHQWPISERRRLLKLAILSLRHQEHEIGALAESVGQMSSPHIRVLHTYHRAAKFLLDLCLAEEAVLEQRVPARTRGEFARRIEDVLALARATGEASLAEELADRWQSSPLHQGFPEEVRRWASTLFLALSGRQLAREEVNQALDIAQASLIGWIDPDDVPDVDSALDESRLVGSGMARHWVDRLVRKGALGPYASVLGAFIGSIAGVRSVTVDPNFRGRRFRSHHSTYLSVEVESDVAASTDLSAWRQYVENDLSEILRIEGARWRDPPDYEEVPCRTPGRMLMVPQHERTRGPGDAPYEAANLPVIFVIGVTYAHAETVGAFVADALDYGYQNSIYAGYWLHGMRPEDDPKQRSQIRVVKDWLDANSDALRPSVCTFAHPAVIRAVYSDLGRPAHLVFVRAGRLLLDEGSRVWRIPFNELWEAQRLLDDARKVRDPARTTVVEIADKSIVDSAGRIDRDLVWDAAVLAAHDAVSDIVRDPAEVARRVARLPR
jgi:hypothetical protein